MPNLIEKYTKKQLFLNSLPQHPPRMTSRSTVSSVEQKMRKMSSPLVSAPKPNVSSGTELLVSAIIACI
jgi:hypothetical protein